MAVKYPPIPEGFLRLFGPEARVEWQDEARGLFVVRTPLCGVGVAAPTTTTVAVRPPPIPSDIVVETPSHLEVPSIPEDRRPADPPMCFHGRPSRTFTCRRDGPNQGRVFYTCGWPEGRRCSFFRWQDENEQFSEVKLLPPLKSTDLQEMTRTVDPDEQMRAWSGLQQGTPEWHRLRSGRVTASNFGSAHHNNSFCTPSNLLRQLLWPHQMDSCAMRYGSVNEKTALRRFSEFMGEYSPDFDLPIFIDEPGI